MRFIQLAVIAGALAQALFAQGEEQGRVIQYDIRRTTDNDAIVSIQLFEDSPYITYKCTRGAGDDHFVGTSYMETKTIANFIIRKNSESLFGSIVDENTSIVNRIMPDGDGVLVVTATKSDEFLQEGEPLSRERTKKEAELSSNNAIDLSVNNEALLDEDCPLMDVMVVWTKKSECANSNLGAGCTLTAMTESNMRGLIDLAVGETNYAYAQSGVTTQLRLVHAYRHPTYDESSGFNTALNHITSTTDGVMDDVHAKRTTWGADIVALIIDHSSYCGLAWLGPSANLMFSVTKWSCATGYYSFGHEIGHNLGCHHDRGTAGACSSSNYNYGWRDLNASFRSILAYNCVSGQCDSNTGGGCTRVQRFSNPTYPYSGLAIGDSGNDNAKQINSVSTSVSSYYQCCPRCPVGHDDGANCFVGRCPWGTTPFVWQNKLYCTTKPSCPIGTYDGANCHICPHPNTPFFWSGNLYYQPILGTTCPCPGTWYDGANCFVAPGSWDPFIWSGGLYVASDPSTNCPMGTYDGANCLVYSPPYGSTAFIWNGGLYYTYTGCGQEPTPMPTPAPVSAPSPTGSCMSGNIDVKLKSGNIAAVKDLKVGDSIKGLNMDGEESYCKVESVGEFGFGPLYGNYTDDHFIYFPPGNNNQSKSIIVPHGKKGAVTNETKYEVLTSCPLGLEQSGKAFTPIDGDFCGNYKKLKW
eukprot:CAMPEP_0195507272 /NCGR_PEP_ID=MMETSP0794_2-20130614/747_1 /TAXON_ID=515487 /ORGANISM="Stephanopyxis turris, Strain CCMP 815" /LENGTH=695 /DNA_ID=CAMNT_0040633901 /DNA_START=1 /DNA_END=2085 /DNA_ORIENTATION=+